MKKISLKWVVAVGCAIGFGIAVQFWPGGYDGLEFCMRSPGQNTTAPAWVYLLTLPLSWLGWPLSWQVLTAVTILVVALAASPLLAVASWLPLLAGSILGVGWMQWGWWLPALSLTWDVVYSVRETAFAGRTDRGERYTATLDWIRRRRRGRSSSSAG